jgi:hypothetical protein
LAEEVIVKSVLLMLFVALDAYAAPATFNSVVCRSYDYYQLGGDRKVVEIAIGKSADGVYSATASHSYEVLLSDGSFRVRDRTVDADFSGLTCLQGGTGDDPRVVTCATPGVAQYVNLARIERTTVMSAFSSRPGQVVKSFDFEGLTMSHDGTVSPIFQDRDCVLK